MSTDTHPGMATMWNGGSEAAAPIPRTVPQGAAGMVPGDHRRRPFAALVLLELRKMTDTRAGLAVTVAATLVTLATIALVPVHGGAEPSTYAGTLSNSISPLFMLLPVIASLSVTSEWGQRSALTTFTLVPRRAAVWWAKVTAGVSSSVCAVALFAGFVAVRIAVVDGTVWSSAHSSAAGAVLGSLVWTALQVLFVMALGLWWRNTPATIVVFFLIPVLFTMVDAVAAHQPALLHAIDAANWNLLASDLTMGTLGSDGWTRLGLCALGWIGVPLAFGLRRLLRSDLP